MKKGTSIVLGEREALFFRGLIRVPLALGGTITGTIAIYLVTGIGFPAEGLEMAAQGMWLVSTTAIRLCNPSWNLRLLRRRCLRLYNICSHNSSLPQRNLINSNNLLQEATPEVETKFLSEETVKEQLASNLKTWVERHSAAQASSPKQLPLETIPGCGWEIYNFLYLLPLLVLLIPLFKHFLCLLRLFIWNLGLPLYRPTYVWENPLYRLHWIYNARLKVSFPVFYLRWRGHRENPRLPKVIYSTKNGWNWAWNKKTGHHSSSL